ncbi:MMPL family transporter, partial [Mycolicibacterium sp. 120266]|uniref:MMPL family transporter n=1 Tax=Mycolicibacterium sp. 120266 TaxID=3090601 RepID=UPI00299EFAC0
PLTNDAAQPLFSAGNDIGVNGGRTAHTVLQRRSRYREELSAGIRTGLIRTIAGSGNVAVTAALVLAGTMLAMLSSDVVNIGQAGATICIGLVFDMMIVRLFLVMPLARVLGPWFWWPQKVPTRRTARFGEHSNVAAGTGESG